ncbi:MAG TPA: class I SAM-dependent methyltransferase [Azospirillaceae bacterium]|nr:class I SAM-dependent methyltransferase [Azospirillaceae bacterium]
MPPQDQTSTTVLTAATTAVPACPACGGGRASRFFHVTHLPANTTQLMRTREAALAERKGPLDLHVCPDCGFVFNAAFDPGLIRLGEDVEETQGFSPTFVRFHRELAADLARRHPLRGGRVLEIGCGKGEFLALLCETADASGLGYDPGFIPGRAGPGEDRILVHKTLFGADEARRAQANLIVCKMTLEHIHRPVDFVSNAHTAAVASGGAPVVFMVPDALRLLRTCQFADFYYEHCSNFSAGALARLFRHCGFAVERLDTVHDDQYLLIEARPLAPGARQGAAPFGIEEPPGVVVCKAEAFAKQVGQVIEAWRARLAGWRDAGSRVVLWGSGSRATALANLVRIGDEVRAFVDINPNRQGTFVAGTGHPVVAPAALTEIRPEVVVVLNPVYRGEIAASVEAMGLTVRIETL